ncbi:MAG: ferrochelatase [candidate division Zixibacteria bacterium]|nr:ferrochelatase [candidate division Zixibacteria bacterium]
MIDKLIKDGRYREYPFGEFDFENEKWGILFLNMGGPETTDDIEPFLYNLFSDPFIIKLPFSSILQKPLARFISSRRAVKVKGNYEAIGGGSPLLRWCRLEAEGVKKELAEKYPLVETFPGMRYTPPFIGEALERAAAAGCKHIVIVSLFPQYTRATTGTALAEVCDWFKNNRTDITFSVIAGWHNHPGYIELLRNSIAEAMAASVAPVKPKLLFSAHSLPVKLVKSGDPYFNQVTETVRLAGEGYDYVLSFQSRSGPVRWLEPETKNIVEKLGHDGVEELVVVPVSFVSDHIETLHEIDIELKELALASGIKKFIRTRSFNDDPRFIKLLAGMVRDKIEGTGEKVL